MSGRGERPGVDHDASPAHEVGEAARPTTSDRAGASESAAGWTGTVAPYFALFDFAASPRSKAAWVVRGAAVAVAVVALWRRVDVATAPLLSAKPPAAVPTEEIEDYKFRLPERTRREIFAQLAAAELAERARAIKANTWKGHLWSREDDRGHHERLAARAAAAKHKVSLTQVYLVLDEGIRERWPGPDGNPLPATTPPFNPRSSW